MEMLNGMDFDSGENQTKFCNYSSAKLKSCIQLIIFISNITVHLSAV